MKMHDDSILIIFKDKEDFDINKDNFIFIAHAKTDIFHNILESIYLNIDEYSEDKKIRIYSDDIDIFRLCDEFFNIRKSRNPNIDWEVGYIKTTINFEWDGKFDFSNKYPNN